MKEVSTTPAKTIPAWLTWGGVTLFIAWLFYCLGAYYVVQKPFSETIYSKLIEESDRWLHINFSVDAMIRTFLDLGAAVWLALIALGVGNWLFKKLSLSMVSDLDAVLFSMGIGFGVLGMGTLFLGLAGLLQPALFYAIAILLTLLTAARSLNLLRRLRISLPSRLITLYLILALGLALTLALLPPSSWDALFYHLKGPKLYLNAGRIYPGVDIPHLNFPSLFEMLFMMAMAIRGDVSAQLLHFVFVFMLAGLVYRIARDHLEVKNGWAAVLFLFSIQMIPILAGWAYNDLALAFYQVIALDALLRWQREKKPSWLILSGVFCGLAMGLKYTSFVSPLLLVGILVWEHKTRWREALRPLLFLILPAVIVAAPWYIKNLIFTGNPVYPFVFGGRFWDDFRSSAYAGTGTGLGFNLLALLSLPHDLTLGLYDASADGPTGPFFLVFLPLLLIYSLSKQRKTIPSAFQYLLLFALAQYLFWTIGVIFSAGLRQSRLLLPAFVALCPALAWIWQDLKRLDHPQFSLQRFLNLTLGLVLLFGLLSQLLTSLPRAPLGYLLGNQTRSDYLLNQLGVHYLVMEELNTQLPPDAVIAFLWEPRSYYCNLDCRPDSILDTFSHLEHLYGNAADITRSWQKDGITHVLLHQAGLDFVITAETPWVAPHDIKTLEELRSSYLTPVTNWDDVYVLYRLAP